MSNLTDLLKSIRSNPGYALMRGVARFDTARSVVTGWRRQLHSEQTAAFLRDCESRFGESVFQSVDRGRIVTQLRERGIALGINLPGDLVEEIKTYTAANPCFADRKPELGFRLEDRLLAQERLGKPILLAQYFNTQARCAAVGRLLRDPVLRWIAARYLESVPTFVGANLWWTFPVQALEADRDRHAHLYHRDVDDFRFFKFFFYLTPVKESDGAHVCVIASHRKPPLIRAGDRWKLRRYSDAEIESFFGTEHILEICGPAGSGFAENTLCLHKALTPTEDARLLLQLQFALFDYGVMHDRRDERALQMIV